jgi:GNAT superfamily N-acetyltransferase
MRHPCQAACRLRAGARARAQARRPGGVLARQINPAWQKAGLGRGVVERLTAALVRDGITTITLFAEPGVVGLYEKLGFVREPSGVQGMAFQRKSSAGGALMLAR